MRAALERQEPKRGWAGTAVISCVRAYAAHNALASARTQNTYAHKRAKRGWNAATGSRESLCPAWHGQGVPLRNDRCASFA